MGMFLNTRLAQLLKERRWKIPEFCRAIKEERGFSLCINTVRNYIAGTTSPDAETLAEIALFFNKPVSFFFNHKLSKVRN